MGKEIEKEMLWTQLACCDHGKSHHESPLPWQISCMTVKSQQSYLQPPKQPEEAQLRVLTCNSFANPRHTDSLQPGFRPVTLTLSRELSLLVSLNMTANLSKPIQLMTGTNDHPMSILRSPDDKHLPLSHRDGSCQWLWYMPSCKALCSIQSL